MRRLIPILVLTVAADHAFTRERPVDIFGDFLVVVDIWAPAEITVTPGNVVVPISKMIGDLGAVRIVSSCLINVNLASGAGCRTSEFKDNGLLIRPRIEGIIVGGKGTARHDKNDEQNEEGETSFFHLSSRLQLDSYSITMEQIICQFLKWDQTSGRIRYLSQRRSICWAINFTIRKFS